jgi:hypothetical protein
MKRIFAGLCLFAALSACIAAHADTTYSYSYSGADVDGSGNFTIATTSTDGVFEVTSISGEMNGTAITGLVSVGDYKNNDNLFYASDTYLDDQGVSFSLKDGANVNIFYSNEDWFVQGDGNFVLDTGSEQANTPLVLRRFSFGPAVAVTPEPSSFALLATGALGAAGMLRRRLVRA